MGGTAPRLAAGIDVGNPGLAFVVHLDWPDKVIDAG
jgi:hypothetical protein